jgi:hypothetical protein
VPLAASETEASTDPSDPSSTRAAAMADVVAGAGSHLRRGWRTMGASGSVLRRRQDESDRASHTCSCQSGVDRGYQVAVPNVS